MRAIVTGGAGFIGSHLVERLLNDGHDVVVLDDLSTGRMKNIEHLVSHPRFTLSKADVSHRDEILSHFKNIDWVFHLAARADIIPSIQMPYGYHRSNVDGTVSVLEAARHHGVRKLIYAASSSCYGIADRFPTPETAPIRPQYPYALTKYIGEEYVMHWGKVYKLPVTSLRLFNVYGPRARTTGTYGAVFGVFLAQKLTHKPFTVVGDGKQRRDFIFVTDVVDAFITAALSSVNGEVFNIGSGESYAINKIVELLKGDVVYIPERPGEPHRTHADIGKIRKSLGWRPKVSLESGIHVLLEDITYWEDAPVWTPETIADATKEWFRYLST